MFGFKSAQQKRIDELAADNARLLKEVAETGVLLTSARDSRDIALRQNAHLRTEVEQLERDVAALLPDAEKHRRNVANLKQYRTQPAHH